MLKKYIWKQIDAVGFSFSESEILKPLKSVLLILLILNMVTQTRWSTVSTHLCLLHVEIFIFSFQKVIKFIDQGKVFNTYYL